MIVQNILVRMFSKYSWRLQRALVSRNVLEKVNGQLESLMVVKDDFQGNLLGCSLHLGSLHKNSNMICVVIYYYRQICSCSFANFKCKNEQIKLQLDLRNIQCFFFEFCFLNFWDLSSQTDCNY